MNDFYAGREVVIVPVDVRVVGTWDDVGVLDSGHNRTGSCLGCKHCHL